MACHSRSRPGLPAALLAAMLAAGSSAAGAAGAQPVAILAYHHIGTPPPGTARPSLWVRAPALRAQLRALRRAGYEAVTLDRVWRAWHRSATLPRHPVVLSFDDGYASQARAALPALRGQGWPGVLNLQAARVGRRGG